SELRHLPGLAPEAPRVLREEVPARPGRVGDRLSDDDPRQGARHPARDAAGRHDLERRHIWHRPGVRGAYAPHARASAAGGPGLIRPDAGRATVSTPRITTAPGRFDVL